MIGGSGVRIQDQVSHEIPDLVVTLETEFGGWCWKLNGLDRKLSACA